MLRMHKILPLLAAKHRSDCVMISIQLQPEHHCSICQTCIALASRPSAAGQSKVIFEAQSTLWGCMVCQPHETTSGAMSDHKAALSLTMCTELKPGLIRQSASAVTSKLLV